LVASSTSNGKAAASSSVEDLDRKRPFREIAGGDGLEQVAPVKVGVGAGDLHRFVPDGRLQAQHRAPVELDEGRLAGGVDEPEAVDAEAFDHAQRARDGAVRHHPHEHVHRSRASAK
jgi:hypothetical protein